MVGPVWDTMVICGILYFGVLVITKPDMSLVQYNKSDSRI